MLKLLRSRGRQAYILGHIRTFEVLPKYVKVLDVWPNLEIHFSDVKEQIATQVRERPDGKTFYASVAAGALGLPPELRPEHNEAAWSRKSEHVFSFQFQPQAHRAEDAEDIERQAAEHLLSLHRLSVVYDDLFHRSLWDRLGIHVTFNGEVPGEDAVLQFDWDDPPHLQHAELRRMVINDTEHEPGWNRLMAEMARGMSETERREDRYRLGLIPGRHERPGFRWLADIGYSIRSRAAGVAWRRAAAAAQALGITVEVEWEWPNRPDVPYPGRRGIMVIRPE